MNIERESSTCSNAISHRYYRGPRGLTSCAPQVPNQIFFERFFVHLSPLSFWSPSTETTCLFQKSGPNQARTTIFHQNKSAICQVYATVLWKRSKVSMISVQMCNAVLKLIFATLFIICNMRSSIFGICHQGRLLLLFYKWKFGKVKFVILV